MKYLMTVTVSSSRDPEINPYTLTETFDCGIEEPLPVAITEQVRWMIAKFNSSWPFPGINKPIRPNVDVTIRDAHAVLSTVEKVA